MALFLMSQRARPSMAQVMQLMEAGLINTRRSVQLLCGQGCHTRSCNYGVWGCPFCFDLRLILLDKRLLGRHQRPHAAREADGVRVGGEVPIEISHSVRHHLWRCWFSYSGGLSSMNDAEKNGICAFCNGIVKGCKRQFFSRAIFIWFAIKFSA